MLLLPHHKLSKQNLLLLGASGGVSNAFLRFFSNNRNLINKLVLLDRSDAVLSDPYINHKKLNYTFIHKKLELPKEEEEYLNILDKYNIDVVLDLTDSDSIPLLEATNKAYISYINTAMNDDNRYVCDLMFEAFRRKKELNRAPHILCTGMNPGVVNMWVRLGIERYGIPEEIVHFEYDTSIVSTGWKPMMTWSLHEFIVESFRDPSGVMLGKDNIKELLPNALKHRVDMKEILSPIMELKKYPKGFQILHEENVSISQKYNIPSQFIYAFNLKTMDTLVDLFEKNKNIYRKDLIVGNNTTLPLNGADNIGVLLKYKNKKVYYFNTAPNFSTVGTSGTYSQVIVGVYAALCTLLFDRKVKQHVQFVEDLFDTNYKYYIFDNMRIEEYVFSKSGRLQKYNPRINLKRKNRLDRFYI